MIKFKKISFKFGVANFLSFVVAVIVAVMMVLGVIKKFIRERCVFLKIKITGK